MNTILNRLHQLISPLGSVYPDGNNIDIMSSETVGAGVGIKQTATGIRLTVIVEQAHVERMILGSGRKRVSSSSLRIRFRGHTVAVRKFKNRYGVKMVIWEPTDPVNEALMQKCVGLVSEVFDKNY